MAAERFFTIPLDAGLNNVQQISQGMPYYSWTVYSLTTGAVVTLQNGPQGDAIPAEPALEWNAPDQCNGETDSLVLNAPAQPGAVLQLYVSLQAGGRLAQGGA